MNLPSARFAQAGALLTESPLRDLEAIIRSRTPLIAVESNEEPQIVRLVRQIGQRLQIKAYRWTVTEGLQAFDPMRSAAAIRRQIAGHAQLHQDRPPHTACSCCWIFIRICRTPFTCGS